MQLRPQLQAIVERMDAQRSKAEEMLKKRGARELTWTPGRGLWTIAQTLDHMSKSVALTLPKMEGALKGAEAAGSERDSVIRYRFGERVFLTMVGPNSPVKIPVPPIFEPDASPNAAKVVKEFFGWHDALRAFVERADGLRIGNVRVTSPVSERFRPGLIAYLDGLTTHEAYHLKQVADLISDPDFPK